MSTPRPRPLPQTPLPVNTHHMVPEYHARSGDTTGVLRCQYCGATGVSTQETCSLHPSEQRRVNLTKESTH